MNKKKYLPIVIIHIITMCSILVFGTYNFFFTKQEAAYKASTFLCLICVLFGLFYLLEGYKREEHIYYQLFFICYCLYNSCNIIAMFITDSINVFAIVGFSIEIILTLLLIVDKLGKRCLLFICGLFIIINLFNFISSVFNNIFINYNESISSLADLSLAITILMIVFHKYKSCINVL